MEISIGLLKMMLRNNLITCLFDKKLMFYESDSLYRKHSQERPDIFSGSV